MLPQISVGVFTRRVADRGLTDPISIFAGGLFGG
jgi:hypothetical protein